LIVLVDCGLGVSYGLLNTLIVLANLLVIAINRLSLLRLDLAKLTLQL
jgi:hypothetical protein